jgi:RHS repeat-associated protein
VFDGVNPYMDFDGDGLLKTRYLYGPGIDELFARIGSGEDPQWYLVDRLGSVRQIADASGAVLDEITYDSFGGILSETNPAQGDRFKFTGREFSPELGIYYYRARWYDPSSGRFISQDPIGFSAGDPNLYRYVGNAPGDATDPEGLEQVYFWQRKNDYESIKITGHFFIIVVLSDGTRKTIGWDGEWKPDGINDTEAAKRANLNFKPDWDIPYYLIEKTFSHLKTKENNKGLYSFFTNNCLHGRERFIETTYFFYKVDSQPEGQWKGPINPFYKFNLDLKTQIYLDTFGKMPEKPEDLNKPKLGFYP